MEDNEIIKRLMELSEDGEDEEENIPSGNSGETELEFSLMEDFPGHRFSLYEGERLDDMVESIKQVGILENILLWKHNGRYIILSGHNRKKAAMLAGYTKGPVAIKTDLTMDEARFIVCESNFRQRSFSDMKHSDRAFSLAEHYKTMKNQGIRKDLIEAIDKNIMQKNDDFYDDEAENLTCAKIEHRLKSRDLLSKEYKLNHFTISQYIKIAELSAELLNLLDEGHIAFAAAYQFTFITDMEAQKTIAKAVQNGIKILASKAKALREYFERNGSLSEEDIKELLKKRSKKETIVTISQKDVRKFFANGETNKQIKETIIELLELYYSDYLKRKERTNE